MAAGNQDGTALPSNRGSKVRNAKDWMTASGKSIGPGPLTRHPVPAAGLRRSGHWQYAALGPAAQGRSLGRRE